MRCPRCSCASFIGSKNRLTCLDCGEALYVVEFIGGWRDGDTLVARSPRLPDVPGYWLIVYCDPSASTEYEYKADELVQR